MEEHVMPSSIRTRRTSEEHAFPARDSRRARVLVVVLVVVAVMTLAAYTFSELMLTEHKAARVVGQQVQSRALVESGAAMLQSYLQQTSDQLLQSGGTYNNAA